MSGKMNPIPMDDSDDIISIFKSFIQNNVALPVAAMNTLVTKIKVLNSLPRICIEITMILIEIESLDLDGARTRVTIFYCIIKELQCF